MTLIQLLPDLRPRERRRRLGGREFRVLRRTLTLFVTCVMVAGMSLPATALDTSAESRGEMVLVDTREVVDLVEDPITGEFVELTGTKQTWVPRADGGPQSFASLAGSCSVNRTVYTPWHSVDEVGVGWAWGAARTSRSSGCTGSEHVTALLMEKFGLTWLFRAWRTLTVYPGQAKTAYAIYNCTGHGTDWWRAEHMQANEHKDAQLTC